MTLKICFKCQENKDTSEFYRHSKMGDGFLSKCKSCTKRDVGEHRLANIEKIRKYDRDRASKPHRRELNKIVTIKNRAKFPAMRSAQSLVAHAVRDGRIERKPCEVCLVDGAHAHHDDYLKPLDVRWLCAAHHRQWHRDNGPGLNGDACVPRRDARVMPTERQLLCA